MSSVNLVPSSTLPYTNPIKKPEQNRVTSICNGIFKNMCSQTAVKVIVFSAVVLTLVESVEGKDPCNMSVAWQYMCFRTVPWSYWNESCRCVFAHIYKGWF